MVPSAHDWSFEKDVRNSRTATQPPMRVNAKLSVADETPDLTQSDIVNDKTPTLCFHNGYADTVSC